MGCSSMSYVCIEGKILKQEQIELDISNITKNKELTQAQSLIKLITNLRNKIIHDYDKLIYSTGACVFKNANITHCIRCLLFTISEECEGNVNLAEFNFKEDIPFFNLNMDKLSTDTQNTINELFKFVIDIKDSRILIKKIELEIPKLMYIIFENNHNISKENLRKIDKAISYFRDLKTFRTNILVQYKGQIYDLIMSNNSYCIPINRIGKLAIEKNIKDKYEIAFLVNELKNEQNFTKYFNNDDLVTFSSINEAKEKMEIKLREQKFDEDNILLKSNSLYSSQNFSSTLSSSCRIQLPKS